MIRINLIRKTLLFAIASACILLSGCQGDTGPACLEVEMIGWDRCGGGWLVSVKSPARIGETISYYDGKTYSNVIKVFTLQTIPESSTGFIRIRDFDPKTDEIFFRICLALYAPIPAPEKVAIFWSEEPC
jgi:hypothetical protein